jgi:hypothetical protein
MFGAKHGGRAALANLTPQGITGERLSNQIFFRHGANVTPIQGH